jgi:hypothetical protein
MSSRKSKIEVVKILEKSEIQEAKKVIQEVYVKEKNWVISTQGQITEELDNNEKESWFLARYDGEPAGLLRLVYDPPLEMPSDFEVTLNKDIDLNKMGETCRFVDIGRFMILPKYRGKILIALRLMRTAVAEVLERDYTHFITDVFQGEPNSPLHFHQKILGFEVIGQHLHGELNCKCMRIILTLDILKAYQRIRNQKNKLYRSLVDGIQDIVDKKLQKQV